MGRLEADVEGQKNELRRVSSKGVNASAFQFTNPALHSFQDPKGGESNEGSDQPQGRKAQEVRAFWSREVPQGWLSKPALADSAILWDYVVWNAQGSPLARRRGGHLFLRVGVQTGSCVTAERSKRDVSCPNLDEPRAHKRSKNTQERTGRRFP